MSATGCCYDNAITESFFGTLKRELVHHCSFVTRQEAQSRIFRYIEGFYNRRRLHSAIGYLAPEQFEQQLKVGGLEKIFVSSIAKTGQNSGHMVFEFSRSQISMSIRILSATISTVLPPSLIPTHGTSLLLQSL